MMNEQDERLANLEHVSAVGKKIYNMIKQSHLTKTEIRNRTSFPAKQIDDELHSLASYNLIKAKKNSNKKNVKTWMLYHEKQEEQQQQMKALNEDLISLILKKDSTLSNIKKQAIKLSYSLQNFNQVIEMLKMKGQIFVNEEEVKIRKLNKLLVPCITCQLKRICAPGNTISPQNCPYLVNW